MLSIDTCGYISESVMLAQNTFHISRDEVRTYLGYEGHEISPELEQRIESIVVACEQSCRPSYIYATYPIEQLPLTLTGTAIHEHLQGAIGCVCMVCTLGLQADTSIRTYSVKSALDAFIYDTAASAYIESVANACEASVVRKAHDKGLMINGRFSPGYADLPLDVQPEILSCLNATRRLGLTVTDEGMLIPTKSITACLGIFDDYGASGMHTALYPERFCARCVCRDYCTLREAKKLCCR